jgi:putative acetyltransferase
MKLLRTDSDNLDFIALVKKLDAELAIRDGDLHDFYHQYNGISHLNYVVVAYWENQAIGCGAIKPYNPEAMEVKRMYTLPDGRGKGVATAILAELERWAQELGYTKCILETGQKQQEAIALYKKQGYQIIPNYGPYAGVDNSVCFTKELAII